MKTSQNRAKRDAQNRQTGSVITGTASKYEYDWLSEFNLAWANRRVRETAAMFRQCGKPQDLALLPGIGDPL